MLFSIQNGIIFYRNNLDVFSIQKFGRFFYPKVLLHKLTAFFQNLRKNHSGFRKKIEKKKKKTPLYKNHIIKVKNNKKRIFYSHQYRSDQIPSIHHQHDNLFALPK